MRYVPGGGGSVVTHEAHCPQLSSRETFWTNLQTLTMYPVLGTRPFSRKHSLVMKPCRVVIILIIILSPSAIWIIIWILSAIKGVSYTSPPTALDKNPNFLITQYIYLSWSTCRTVFRAGRVHILSLVQSTMLHTVCLLLHYFTANKVWPWIVVASTRMLCLCSVLQCAVSPGARVWADVRYLMLSLWSFQEQLLGGKQTVQTSAVFYCGIN